MTRKDFHQKRAAILAIGTEITTGQIADTNSQWIANELTNLRWEVTLTASVPDQVESIEALLNTAAAKADVLILSGGLGPTSDDLTRNAVARWCGAPLEYDESSWSLIEARFAELGRKPASSNKQQCFFPKGSQILVNTHGTANAFRFQKGSVIGFCLPGVPSELKYLWTEHIVPALDALNKGASRLHLERWHTLGKSEAEVAELVESQIKDKPLLAGYRPHFPYIETKIWCWEEDWKACASAMGSIDAILKPWLIAKNDEDLAQSFVKSLPMGEPVIFWDNGTAGALARRLSKPLAERPHQQNASVIIQTGFAAGENMQVDTPSAYRFRIEALDENAKWQVQWAKPHKEWQTAVLESPDGKRPILRQKEYQAELSIYYWYQMLRGSLDA